MVALVVFFWTTLPPSRFRHREVKVFLVVLFGSLLVLVFSSYNSVQLTSLSSEKRRKDIGPPFEMSMQGVRGGGGKQIYFAYARTCAAFGSVNGWENAGEDSLRRKPFCWSFVP